MWLKVLILVLAVGGVIYAYRKFSSARSDAAASGPNGDGSNSKAPDRAQDGNVDLVRCPGCGGYVPDGQFCGSCGKPLT